MIRYNQLFKKSAKWLFSKPKNFIKKIMILVTGGAGFIGANFILDWFKQLNNQLNQQTDIAETHYQEALFNIDKLTYAGNLATLKSLENNPYYQFERADICDRNALNKILSENKLRAIIHFAAESHVDRSIHSPADFVQTNVMGTFTLLEAARAYWNTLNKNEKEYFRFIHISTDEVYGTLNNTDEPFKETTAYAPNSPYSASKASSDHLVRAYYHTYGLPTITTNCSNNYGPYQFPEKFIPLIIQNAIAGKALPVYGDGQNIRDWLYVGDHCAAIREVLAKGKPSETYNIGGLNEKKNIDVVQTICDLLDQLKPNVKGAYKNQITFVKDRPGHDKRYAINSNKIQKELNWKPKESFETGIKKTIEWYLNNDEWINSLNAQVQTGEYHQ